MVIIMQLYALTNYEKENVNEILMKELKKTVIFLGVFFAAFLVFELICDAAFGAVPAKNGRMLDTSTAVITTIVLCVAFAAGLIGEFSVRVNKISSNTIARNNRYLVPGYITAIIAKIAMKLYVYLETVHN